MAWQQEEYNFMRRCFDLASRGLGQVAPNPMVGCVIVKNGEIISEGYHKIWGGPHAEINALKNLKSIHKGNLHDSVMYVSLEPCNHHGKTPPCSEAIIDSGISKVVVSNLDPNPLVAGSGLERLRSAGLDVQHGILQEEGAFLNRRFFVYHQKKRPYVILKWANSADGFLAPMADKREVQKQPYWISSEPSRALVQKWRAEEQGILVGKNTVLEDNPRLTTRHPGGRNPIRIIIDPSKSLRTHFHVFNEEGRVMVLNNQQTSQQNNIEYLKFKENDVADILHQLYRSNVQSILVEGGKFTLDQFINSGLWDECRVFTSPKFLKMGLSAPTIPSKPTHTEVIGDDSLQIFYNKSWC